MKFKEFVNVFKNKNNNQIKFEVRKRKLKEMDIEVKDILNLKIPLSKKIKKMREI